jgi:hypothetical protein
VSIGANTFCFANNGAALGTKGYAFGDYALGISGIAGGAYSCSLLGVTGNLVGSSLFPAYITTPTTTSTAIATGTSSAFVVPVASATGFEVGQFYKISWQPTVSGPYVQLESTVSSISGTNITFSTSTLPFVLPASGSKLYNVSQGQYGSAIGSGAYVLNYGAVAVSNITNATQGDLQTEPIVLLGGQTTNTTPQILTLDGYNPVNTNKTFGNANRFITETNKAYDCTLSIVAKQTGTANCVRFKRTFLAVNNGGTVTVSALSTLGTDVAIGSWSTSTVSFSVGTTSGYNSIDVTVTGISGTVNWLARMDFNEVLV